MPAAFKTGYDDRDGDEKARAQRQCERVCAALRAAGIVAGVTDDPPWMDAGNLSGYFQDCSWGNLFVMVTADDLERAKTIAAKTAGAAPEV